MGKLKDILIGLAVAIALVAFGWFVVPAWWRWHVHNWQSFQNNLATRGESYCSSIKRIVDVEQIFEDNGKYEDESYKVKYDDGTVGLVDEAQMKSGTYCVSQKFIKDHESVPEGWVLNQ